MRIKFGLKLFEVKPKKKLFKFINRKYHFLSHSYLLLIAAIICLSLPVQSQDLEVAQFFKINCNSCHWIGGGRLIGPDLKNVAQRKDRDWLLRFIIDPKTMLDSQDPYVMKLKTEAKGAIMINIPGMTRSMADNLLNLIDEESKLDSSMFFGKKIPVVVYSEEDIAKGNDLFSGRMHLTNDGPSCVNCHTVNVIGGSLGGQLGPDLTMVFNRLQGQNALTAWLSAPPTETMRSIFKDHNLSEDEIKYIVAFFQSASINNDYNFDTFFVWMTVIFCGLGGSLFATVIFGGIWSDRFKAVRRPMVDKMKRKL